MYTEFDDLKYYYVLLKNHCFKKQHKYHLRRYMQTHLCLKLSMKINQVIMKALLNLLLRLFLYISAHASGKVYNIVPTQIPPYVCSIDPCLTLSQFARKSTNYIALNTTLIFNGENHSLDIGILIANIAEFSMQSVISNDHTSVPVITCNKSANFNFTNIRSLHLSGLKFKRCDENKFEFIDQLKIEYSTFLDSKSPLTVFNSSSVSMIGNRFLSNFGNYRKKFRRLMEHLDHDQLLTVSIGGALIISGSNIDIENCYFIRNNGGAIFSEFGSHITISNSTFSSNHAQDCVSGHCAGGALLIDSRSIVVISSSLFHNNTAEFDGGMIAAFNSTLLVLQSNISNNTALKYGGIVAAFLNSSIMFKFISMNDNQAELGGGAMYLLESRATLDNCKIVNNKARGDGGVIYGAHNSIVKVSNSTLSNNKAQRHGGAIYGKNNSRVAFNNCRIDCNFAEYRGLVRIDINSTVHIVSSNFTANNAHEKGGVAHVYNRSVITIEHSNMIDNWANGYGGAVSIDKDSTLNIRSSNLDDNRADYGGALDVTTGSITNIALSNFGRNRARNSAAALHVYNSSAAFIESSNFSWNAAVDTGAAVYGRINCTISINNSIIRNSMAEFSGSGVYVGHDSNIHIRNCTFFNNTADFGAAVLAFVRTSVVIVDSIFNWNRATIEGGALHAYKNSSVRVWSSTFNSNEAGSGGASFALLDCGLTFRNSLFLNNSADFGGVMGLLEGSTISITGGTFTYNSAQSGGVVYAHHSKVVIEMHVTFDFNSAGLFGGVVHASDESIITISKITSINNFADSGGVVSLLYRSVGFIAHSNFTINLANDSGGVIYLSKASVSISNSRFHSSSATMRGGVVSASSSSAVYIAGSSFSHSTAKMGAALAVVENSTLSFTSQQYLGVTHPEIQIPTDGNDKTLINNSRALWFGGGIYLGDSCLYVGIETEICFNNAGSFGGGIHAVNSSIKVKCIIHFVSNKATSGGGLSLSNSTLYDNIIMIDEGTITNMNFVSNQAYYGGALYNDDKDIADVCSGEYSSTSGCFFQNVSNAFTINFDKNFATYGDNLYGGLLDRCAGTSTTDQKHGIARFISISNITTVLKSISSKPVQVCFCENGMLNCNMRSHSFQVKNRSNLILQLAAIDQMNHMVTAKIWTLVNDFKIAEEQATQVINASCSNVSYHITSTSPLIRAVPYVATIYADGPCNDKGISKLTINIDIVPCTCAPGFEIDGTENNKKCKCNCDQQLLEYGYINECDPDTDSVERKGVFWITVTDADDGNFSYVFFPYCPVHYCQSPSKSVHVKLGQFNGSDTQCANNHAGLLCGKCQQHYSLSLGSSKCIQCYKKWYGHFIGIVIASLFAGIFLVFLILVLNLTVAVGTLNSVIFYANIVHSSRILTQSRLSSVFISWLNLDIGFDVCFYEGMDAYTKTWIELAFPAYIIFLVIAIILVSSHSSKFSNLIGKRNPVATLATLLLISYTKFLQTIIITFSFVKSNGSIKPATRWLYDASIVYFGWKHALLFFTAVVILIFGLFYTILLFSWQWLLHCPRSNVFNWTRNQKLHSFIDTYHTPYTAKHRYWTGLLLLARVILYLIAAFSASVYADPYIPLLATIIVMCGLLLFKTVMMIKLYRNWLLNAMDSLLCFNIIIPAIFTFADQSFQSKVINLSVGITVILLCFVIAFHVFRYSSVKLYTYCQNTKLCANMTRWLLVFIQSQEKSSNRPSGGGLLDILDSMRQDETEEIIYDQHEQPTSSVVSLVHSEESPSSDYCPKLIEEENQSDHQSDIYIENNTLQQERVKRSMSTS